MAGFLYYIPAESGCTARVIERCGLAYALPADGKGVTTRGCIGPDGDKGVCAARAGEDMEQHVGYFADRQTWRKGPEGRYWIGVVNDARPTPEALERAGLTPGYTLPLGDGNRWIVPLVRKVDGSTLLPQAMDVDESGALIFHTLQKHDSIVALADRAFRQFRAQCDMEAKLPGAGDVITDQAEWWTIAVAALAHNYHVGPQEVGLLRLLRTDTVRDIVGLMIDLPVILQAASEKKSRPGGSATGSGVTDASPTTNPPTPTSGGTPTTSQPDNA